MSKGDYRTTLRTLSDRLVEAQKPIRILDAVMWDESVEQAFFDSGARELPAVDAGYYEGRPLGYDPEQKIEELHALEREVTQRLGAANPAGQILQRMCREYATVVRMLAARGRPEFSLLSRELYGSADDALYEGDPTLADLAVLLSQALAQIAAAEPNGQPERALEGPVAVAQLQDRLARAFGDLETVSVRLADGILADAAAGADCVKLRREATFTEQDLRLLEVHEGWVHLGTTLNGRRQPICTFLSKGPPSSTITQEGLAVLMEVLTMSSRPQRLRRLTDRIEGIRKAEHGADFLDLYRGFCERGEDERDAFRLATRVFRGSTPTGGPFAKDLSYTKGFVQVYNYMLLAIRRGQRRRIPMLFCGKTTLRDVRTLDELADEGLVERPSFLPPPVADLDGLTAWMCFASFLQRLDLGRIEADYAELL